MMNLLLTLPILVLLACALVYGSPLAQSAGTPREIARFVRRMTHLCLAGGAGALVALSVILLLGNGSASGEVVTDAIHFLCPPTAAMAMVLYLVNQSWRGSQRRSGNGKDAPARDEAPRTDGFSIAPW